jgi:uncharacterized protein (DUF2235 family)
MFELLRKDSQRQICYYQPGIGAYNTQAPLQVQATHISLPAQLSMAVDAAFAKYVVFPVQSASLWCGQLITIWTLNEAEYEVTSLEDTISS